MKWGLQCGLKTIFVVFTPIKIKKGGKEVKYKNNFKSQRDFLKNIKLKEGEIDSSFFASAYLIRKKEAVKHFLMRMCKEINIFLLISKKLLIN